MFPSNSRCRTVLTLLAIATSIWSFAFATPTGTPSHYMIIRDDDDAGGNLPDDPDIRLPPHLKPQLKGDHLEAGDVKRAIQDLKSESRPPGYQDAPDYDPDQDPLSGNKDKNSQNSQAESRPKTLPLRSVGVEVGPGEPKKSVKEAFKQSPDKKFIIIEVVGGETTDRTRKVKMTETEEEIKDEDPEKPWEADHVCELGLFTRTIDQRKPSGIDQAAWSLVNRSIMGNRVTEKKYTPNSNTRILGHNLNDPANVRGITWSHNSIKNSVALWGYGKQEQSKRWGGQTRATAWFLYKYRQMTQDQFDEVLDKALGAIHDFVDDEIRSTPIVDHFREQVNKFNVRMDIELERVLENPPPPANDENQIFKENDCVNTRYTPADGGDDSAVKPVTAGPAPEHAPYAEGVCTLNLNQTTTDHTKANTEYMFESQTFDSAGVSMGYDQPETASPTHPLKLQSKLEDLLEMVPSKDHGGMVSFTLAAQKWNTLQDNEKTIPYCKKNRDSIVDGKWAKKNYECHFTCKWNKGKSSDGTN